MEYMEASEILLSRIPREEIERLKDGMKEFSPDFMGFIDTYYYLSKIIPKDFVVIDFGAGWNAQSYFFTNHKKYIAVNPHSEEGDDAMFCPPNCEIYRMTTLDFLNRVNYPKEKVFAICNYVPNWYNQDSIALVKANFRNIFTFYP